MVWRMHHSAWTKQPWPALYAFLDTPELRNGETQISYMYCATPPIGFPTQIIHSPFAWFSFLMSTVKGTSPDCRFWCTNIVV